MRKSCVAAVCAVVLASSPAFAETPRTELDRAAVPATAEPVGTFEYTTPVEPAPLRALLELGAVFTLGFAWYATTAPTVQNWDPGYRWSTFRDKITGGDVGLDANSLGTNFIGHPLGGTGYYLAARSNRLGILQSFGFTIAGSLLWEVFGEVSEVVSTNDMIVTPLAGLSIGESTIQLASHFDRSAPSPGNRVAGAVFGPIKTINDALDGVEPERVRHGEVPKDWHQFHAELAGTLAIVDATPAVPGRSWPEARLALGSEVVRLPASAEAGRAAGFFDDGNASRIELTLTAGEVGVTDLAFRTQAVLAGGYYRARRLDAQGGAWGGSGWAGVGSGFQYTLHQYRRDQGRAMDRIASVQPFGLVFEQRGVLGRPAVVTALEVGPDFGGVTPVAIADFTGQKAELPVVQAARGYYFAVGGHLHASVALELGSLRASGEFLGESFVDAGGSKGPEPVALSDTLVLYGGALGFCDSSTGITPRAFVQRRERAGKVGQARGSRGETTLGLGLGAVF